MAHNPGLFLYRNKDKQLIKNIMNNLDWQANENSDDLAKQDKYSMEQLHAMQLVARMKEAADKAGAGFVGGFVTPSGQRFMMSNVDEGDIQFQAIHRELQDIQNSRVDSSDSFFDRFQNTVKILESEEGIQIVVEPEAE